MMHSTNERESKHTRTRGRESLMLAIQYLTKLQLLLHGDEGILLGNGTFELLLSR